MNYIILVDGTYASGKSTFVMTLCGKEDRWVFTEDSIIKIDEDDPIWCHKATMVGAIFADFGTDKLFLVSLPSALQYYDFWNHIFDVKHHKFLGALVMIDSTKQYTFSDAKSHAMNLYASGIEPILCVANRQDLPDALTPEDVEILFHMTNSIKMEVPFLPCVATDLDSVKAITIRLLEEYLKTTQ